MVAILPRTYRVRQGNLPSFRERAKDNSSYRFWACGDAFLSLCRLSKVPQLPCPAIKYTVRARVTPYLFVEILESLRCLQCI